MNDESLQQQQFVLMSDETGNGKVALAQKESDGGLSLEAKYEEIGQESSVALVPALSDFASQLL